MNGNEANAEALQFSASPLAVNGSVGATQGYGTIAGSGGSESAPVRWVPSPFPIRSSGLTCSSGTWALSMKFPKNVLLSVAYVGSKGTHLTRQFDLNQLTPFSRPESLCGQ